MVIQCKNSITNHKQNVRKFIYKRFLLERDLRKQLRACPPFLLLPVYIYIYTVAGAHALRSLAGNCTRAGSKELKYGYSM